MAHLVQWRHRRQRQSDVDDALYRPNNFPELDVLHRVVAETSDDKVMFGCHCLGAKLSVYLIQFPPSKAFDQEEVGALFDGIHQRSSVDLACEPRHASWFTPKAENWFTQQHICRVAADPPRAPNANNPGGRSDLQYFRLHGTPRIYYSTYNDRFLSELDARLSGTRQCDIWCIFDNTALGAALENALRLRDLHVVNS